MNLDSLDIPREIRCAKSSRGRITLSSREIENLRERGSGGDTYSALKTKKCEGCPEYCQLSKLMLAISQASHSLYPDVEGEN